MKAILFDLDGTLINSKEGITKSAQYTLKQFGIEEPDLDKLSFFIGPPIVDSFKTYYHFTQEQAEQAVEIYRKRYAPIGIKECELYPGAKECLQRLNEQGYILGLASCKPEKYCRIILEHLGILEFFDNVAGASMDGSIGTKGEVLQEAFRRWNFIPKEETCLVGDTMFDVNGAKEHGIPCIAVTFGFGNVEEMKEAGAVLCNSLFDLPDMLEKKRI